MMLVRTSVKPSLLHGLGLFAADDIPKGTHVWKYEPKFDLELTQQEMDALPEATRESVFNYVYKSNVTGNWILCSDDARFINHSRTPNLGTTQVTGEQETRAVAARDIKAGEELTLDYAIFPEGDDLSTYN